MQSFRFTRQGKFKSWYCELRHHEVMRQDTNVSEDFVASIFWVKESSVFNERLNTKILVVMVLMWLSEL